MNQVLTRKDVLMGISPALVDELEQLIARAQIVFEKEHNPQTGEHREISPTGLAWRGAVVSTVGVAGGASALPATPSGYLLFMYGGSTFQLPFYLGA